MPLEDEPWFHSTISRDEIDALLKLDGDYLVRESKKQSSYVLSVRWEGVRHFIIQEDESVSESLYIL